MENQKILWKTRKKYGKPEKNMENQKILWKTRKKKEIVFLKNLFI